MLGRLRMSIDECIADWVELSKKIFQPKHRKFNLLRVVDFLKANGRFDAEILEAGIKEIIKKRLSRRYGAAEGEEEEEGEEGTEALEETLLWDQDQDDDGCKVFVCAVKGEDKMPVFLRSYDNEKQSDHYSADIKIWEACRATSAATTFFDRFERTSQGVRQTFVDGAFAYNNPVSRVHQEAIDLWGDKESLLISIGTGDKPDSSMTGGLKSLLAGIVDIVLATDKEDREFKEEHLDLIDAGLFYRFNVQGIARIGIEEYKKLDEISAVTKSHLSRPDTNRSMKFCVTKAVEGRVEPESQEVLDSETEISAYNPDRQEVGAFLRNIYRHTYAYSEYLESVPTRLDGTGEWLFNSQEYRTWRDLDEHMVLWVTANPGCGKTVTAKETVKRLDKPENGSRAFYFFFKSGNMNQTEWRHAICSLLYQLIFRENKLSRMILPEYHAKGDPLFAEVNALWKLFLLVVLDAKTLYDRVFCIIDALDEGESDTQDLIVRHLGQLTTTEGVKFLVTSSPSINIQRTNRSPSVLRIKGENGLISLTSDISIMIDREVHNLLEEYGLPIQSCRLLAEKLKARSGGTFLWVSLVFKMLRGSGNTSMAWKSILRKLDEMPKDLKQLYEYALSQSPDIGDTKKVLCIILAAYRPLRLGELNILLRIDGAKTVADLEKFLEPESRIEFVVRGLCGIFIYIADDKVHLIHETAREFLLGLDASEILGSKISLVESHEIVAHGCLTYLLIPGYQVCESGTGVLSFYAARYWSDHNLDSRRITHDTKAGFFSRYSFRVPRPIDAVIAEACDPGSSNNIYSSIHYKSDALDKCSTSIILGVIWASNRRGRMVDGGLLWKEAIKRRYAIGSGLFFRFLEARLVKSYLRENLNEEISGVIDDELAKKTANYVVELIVKFFQREELTPELAIKALGDDINNNLRADASAFGFVWSQIYSLGYRSDQDEMRKKNLLEWALLVSCIGHSVYSTPRNQIPQLLHIQSYDRSIYSSMIQTILSLGQSGAEPNLDLVMCHLRKDLGSDAYLEMLNETWEKAYQDGRHEAFEYLQEHNSIRYLATKDLDHAWLIAMCRSRYNSAKYFRDKGARYQFTTLLHDASCGGGSETGFNNILGPRIEGYLGHISLSDVVSIDEAHEILWAVFAVVTGNLASYLNYSRKQKMIGPDRRFRDPKNDDYFNWLGWEGKGKDISILVQSIDLVASLESSLPGAFLGGLNAVGTNFSNPSEDGALITSNIFRLLAFYSTWVRNYSGKWVSRGLLTSFRWEAELNESDRHEIGILQLTFGDESILDCPIELLTLKEATEAQSLVLAAILSYRPEISEAILRRTIPRIDVNAFFCHSPSDMYQDLHFRLQTLLKRRRRLGSVSGQVGEIPQLEDSIRGFIRALAFGAKSFYLNPLGLAVRLQNYEAMRLLASYGADPWLEASQPHRKDQIQGLSAMACATRNELQPNSSISGPAPRDQKDKPEHGFLAIANAMGVDLRVDFDKAGNLTGKTLLHYAIEHSSESVVKFLLDLGANTSVVDNEMRTALHVAVTVNPSEQSLGILSEIIERDGGKSPEKLDNKGRTPYALAKSLHAHNNEYWARISGPLETAEMMTFSCIQRNWKSSIERVTNSLPVEGKVDDWMEISDADIWEEDTDDTLSDQN
ncbi:hypothetical protein TWF106_009370 [Orbilia oligospora]|uniref:phospholipase A2 n=1 Tax=Orbilia oligospora TaxID=2813651 RepID=A0A7C8UKN3_ORBOL|nr:hypothetical protein TWF106_009370 [Orbilia oligospora]